MSGWYPDPARRFDYRFHNGDVWTADVSKAGRRYVDGLPIEPPRRRGNGLAVAGMVCGITGLTIGWLPFIAFLGLVTSVVGIVCSLVGFARSRTTGAGRGFAVAGIATSALGIVAAAVGILLTVVLVRMIDEFYEPGPVEARLTTCTVGGSDVTFTGVVRNQSDEERTYSVLVEVDVGLVERQRRVTVDDVPAGASEEFTRPRPAGRPRRRGAGLPRRLRRRAAPVRPRPHELRLTRRIWAQFFATLGNERAQKLIRWLAALASADGQIVVLVAAIHAA